MIPRYDIPEISKIWHEAQKYDYFLKVEIALLDALEKNEIIPKEITKEFSDNAKIDLDRIHEIEKTTRHDVIAFCSSITENFDAKISKFFH